MNALTLSKEGSTVHWQHGDWTGSVELPRDERGPWKWSWDQADPPECCEEIEELVASQIAQMNSDSLELPAHQVAAWWVDRLVVLSGSDNDGYSETIDLEATALEWCALAGWDYEQDEDHLAYCLKATGEEVAKATQERFRRFCDGKGLQL